MTTSLESGAGGPSTIVPAPRHLGQLRNKAAATDRSRYWLEARQSLQAPQADWTISSSEGVQRSKGEVSGQKKSGPRAMLEGRVSGDGLLGQCAHFWPAPLAAITIASVETVTAILNA
jgi:hypothetical protein